MLLQREASGYFIYDEQYVHIDGTEKYRVLLKDSKTGEFVESILDDLSEETLIDFFVRSIPRFNVDKEIYVTTDGFHYSSILKEASHILAIRIKRQRCLFHIEKDMAHRIKDAHKEHELDMAKKPISVSSERSSRIDSTKFPVFESLRRALYFSSPSM